MAKREIKETEVINMITEAVGTMTTEAVECMFNNLYEDGGLLTGRKTIKYVNGEMYEITEG
jgi:hypothetical protein